MDQSTATSQVVRLLGYAVCAVSLLLAAAFAFIWKIENTIFGGDPQNRPKVAASFGVAEFAWGNTLGETVRNARLASSTPGTA
jgi:hypothetical protein